MGRREGGKKEGRKEGKKEGRERRRKGEREEGTDGGAEADLGGYELDAPPFFDKLSYVFFCSGTTQKH